MEELNGFFHIETNTVGTVLVIYIYEPRCEKTCL